MARLNTDAVLFTLSIVINDKRYREFIKKQNLELYNRIYKSKEEYTREDIISFFLSIDANTFNSIMFMQDRLANESPRGQIGTSKQWYDISLTCVTAQGGYISTTNKELDDQNKQDDTDFPEEHEESVCTGASSRGQYAKIR